MRLSSEPTTTQRSQHGFRVVAELPTLKLAEPMTTEEALTQFAFFVKEKGLDLRGIMFDYNGKQHDYNRTKKSAGAEAQKIEAVVRCGRTRLTVSFAGDASAERMREIQEAANRTARRIELCETIIGTSLPMRKLKETVELATSCNSTTLITGESGTGKELVAQTIHNLSDRPSTPSVSVY